MRAKEAEAEGFASIEESQKFLEELRHPNRPITNPLLPYFDES
jgi:hypothetical protein